MEIKKKQEKNRGLPSIRSTMSNESGASFRLCSLGWRAMEEENEEITLRKLGDGRGTNEQHRDEVMVGDRRLQRATRDGWARLGRGLQWRRFKIEKVITFSIMPKIKKI